MCGFLIGHTPAMRTQMCECFFEFWITVFFSIYLALIFRPGFTWACLAQWNQKNSKSANPPHPSCTPDTLNQTPKVFLRKQLLFEHYLTLLFQSTNIIMKAPGNEWMFLPYTRHTELLNVLITWSLAHLTYHIHIFSSNGPSNPIFFHPYNCVIKKWIPFI